MKDLAAKLADRRRVILCCGLLALTLNGCTSVPRYLSFHTERGPSAFSVGPQVGQLCGRKTKLQEMQLIVSDLERSKTDLERILQKYKSEPLRDHCEYYRQRQHLGAYEEYFQTTQWIPEAKFRRVQNEITKIGELQYADIDGTLGSIDEKLLPKWGAMYKETLNSIPVHVILLQNNRPPPADDPVAIVNGQLSAFGVAVSSGMTMFDKLEILFTKSELPDMQQINWIAGWGYRKNAPNDEFGVTLSKMNGGVGVKFDETRLVIAYVSYGPTLRLPFKREALAAASSLLGQHAGQYKKPTENGSEIVIESPLTTAPPSNYVDTFRMRKLNNRIYIIQLISNWPLTQPAYMIFYKDIDAFFKGL